MKHGRIGIHVVDYCSEEIKTILICRLFPAQEATAAHELLEEGAHIDRIMFQW